MQLTIPLAKCVTATQRAHVESASYDTCRRFAFYCVFSANLFLSFQCFLWFFSDSCIYVALFYLFEANTLSLTEISFCKMKRTNFSTFSLFINHFFSFNYCMQYTFTSLEYLKRRFFLKNTSDFFHFISFKHSSCEN